MSDIPLWQPPVDDKAPDTPDFPPMRLIEEADGVDVSFLFVAAIFVVGMLTGALLITTLFSCK